VNPSLRLLCRQTTVPSRHRHPANRRTIRPGISEKAQHSVECDPNATRHQRHAAAGSCEISAWKRTFDLSLILLVLPLIIIAAIALFCWIRLVSPGNVLFRHTRIGRGGKPFTIYKFRSMKPDAATYPHDVHVEQLIKCNQPMTKLDLTGDPRLIKGGGLIRMSGLDELPQLINVVRGEMSLVGPRPCMPKEFDLYGADQMRRFSLLPGLTGLWQIKRTRSTTFREMVAMDEDYADGLSPWLDLKIVLGTPGALLTQMSHFAQASAAKNAAGRGVAKRVSSASISNATFAHGMGITQKLTD